MLKELLMKNRSFRGYDESFRLTRAELLELVDLTRYTASSVNQQPLKYYIASDPEEVKNILPLTMWAKALKEMSLPHPGMGPSAFIIISCETPLTMHAYLSTGRSSQPQPPGPDRDRPLQAGIDFSFQSPVPHCSCS